MSKEIFDRVVALRKKVIDQTNREFEAGGCGKSAEGTVELTWPSMWQEEGCDPEAYSVMVYSYVLGPSRAHYFYGNSFDEALTKAEEAVDVWVWESQEALKAEKGDDDGFSNCRLGL